MGLRDRALIALTVYPRIVPPASTTGAVTMFPLDEVERIVI